MDLLRAAIAGSNGTPYHDGLFFFDIYLPPQYPHEPPVRKVFSRNSLNTIICLDFFSPTSSI